MAIIRKIKESPIPQGVGESLAYTLTTTPWVSSPTSPTVTLKNRHKVDVSATCLSGSASAANDVITTPLVTALAAERYTINIRWTAGGNTWIAWGYIDGEE